MSAQDNMSKRQFKAQLATWAKSLSERDLARETQPSRLSQWSPEEQAALTHENARRIRGAAK